MNSRERCLPSIEQCLRRNTLSGARGLLAEEEERLFRLRQEIEGEARQELDRARVELEEAGRTTQAGKLCATPFGVDVVGITEFIALTGALVGGKSASLSAFLSFLWSPPLTEADMLSVRIKI